MKTVQATQEASRIQHLQNMKFLYFIFIFLWVILAIYIWIRTQPTKKSFLFENNVFIEPSRHRPALTDVQGKNSKII